MKKDDELICIFMKWRKDDWGDWIHPINGCHYKLNGLCFKTSWDWLMPVVEKIQLFAHVKIENTQCVISVNGECITWPHSGTNIQNVYRAVIEYIKWYNESGVGKSNQEALEKE